MPSTGPTTGFIGAVALLSIGAVGAAGAAGFHFLPTDAEEAVVAVQHPSSNPDMSLEQEIATERNADMAAANLGDVWLEPADFEDGGSHF